MNYSFDYYTSTIWIFLFFLNEEFLMYLTHLRWLLPFCYCNSSQKDQLLALSFTYRKDVATMLFFDCHVRLARICRGQLDRFNICVAASCMAKAWTYYKWRLTVFLTYLLRCIGGCVSVHMLWWCWCICMWYIYGCIMCCMGVWDTSGCWLQQRSVAGRESWSRERSRDGCRAQTTGKYKPTDRAQTLQTMRSIAATRATRFAPEFIHPASLTSVVPPQFYHIT